MVVVVEAEEAVVEAEEAAVEAEEAAAEAEEATIPSLLILIDTRATDRAAASCRRPCREDRNQTQPRGLLSTITRILLVLSECSSTQPAIRL